MFSTFGPTCPLPFAFGSVGCSSRFAQIILVSALRYFLRKRTSIAIMLSCATASGSPRWRTTPTHPSLPSFAPTGPTPTTVLPRPSLTLSRVASKIILQAGTTFDLAGPAVNPGPPPSPPSSRCRLIFSFGNLATSETTATAPWEPTAAAPPALPNLTTARRRTTW